MLLQIFADGTVIDGEGVHKIGPDALKPVIEAVGSGELAKLKGHCGGPAGDFIETVHVVAFDRAYGRLRASSFSYSGSTARVRPRRPPPPEGARRGPGPGQLDRPDLGPLDRADERPGRPLGRRARLRNQHDPGDAEPAGAQHPLIIGSGPADPLEAPRGSARTRNRPPIRSPTRAVLIEWAVPPPSRPGRSARLPFRLANQDSPHAGAFHPARSPRRTRDGGG